jgi:flavodoxin
MKLTLLVGTMTGTAQLVAQELELAWDDGEVQVETLLMDKLDSSVFAREGVFLIVTSTYGQGDVPDNAKALFEDLKAKRPDLSRVRYGVFGLGDRTYAAHRRAGAARRRLGRAARGDGHGVGRGLDRAGERGGRSRRILTWVRMNEGEPCNQATFHAFTTLPRTWSAGT